MRIKKFTLFFLLFFLAAPVLASSDKKEQDADQQINDFSLAGYGDKGKKTWDLHGRTADIFEEVIKLKDVNGNLYGKDEDINLTAKRGDFNKVQGKVHLEDTVIITTSGGARLTTDSLDWDRKKQWVTTPDLVNIERENMFTTATGAKGEPNLNKVTLEKDVTVRINPANETKDKAETVEDRTVITCDGPLDIDYQSNIAVFNNNVKVDRQDSQIYSDKMDVYFVPGKDKASEDKAPSLMGSKIEKIIARGNVRIHQGENISYSQEAIYLAGDKRVTLLGNPKLVIYSTEEFGASFGN